MKRQSLTVNAVATYVTQDQPGELVNLSLNRLHTAMTEGKWKPPVLSPPLPATRFRIDSTIRMSETAVIRKQKVMLPAVSMRALPEGKDLESTELTARLERIRVRLLS